MLIKTQLFINYAILRNTANRHPPTGIHQQATAIEHLGTLRPNPLEGVLGTEEQDNSRNVWGLRCVLWVITKAQCLILPPQFLIGQKEEKELIFIARDFRIGMAAP